MISVRKTRCKFDSASKADLLLVHNEDYICQIKKNISPAIYSGSLHSWICKIYDDCHVTLNTGDKKCSLKHFAKSETACTFFYVVNTFERQVQTGFALLQMVTLEPLPFLSLDQQVPLSNIFFFSLLCGQWRHFWNKKFSS